LHHLRQAYKLPTYQAHNALTDALATAELFLAMASRIAGNHPLAIKRLLT
jgi:DNA polymerase-3 subunit epsilon